MRFLVVLLVGLTTSGGVSACSCVTVGNPDPTPCARISPTEVIFVGTVLDIENPPYEVSSENPEAPLSRYRFRVDESISGLRAGQEIDIYSGRGGADCSYHFAKGQQYLVFPYRGPANDRLFATICSDTRPINEAQAMLPQLRAARDSDRVASIYGLLQISQQPYLSVTDGPSPEPLRDTQIELWDGDHVFESNTNSEGMFAIYSVPPGVYHLRATLPPNVEFARPIVNDPPAPITLVAGACSEYNVTALPTSRIRGRVIGPNGAPLRSAEVELFRPDKYQPSPLLMSWQELQAEKGFFEFLHVSPGDYILVYNNSEERETNRSGRRCFYPGVSDVARAGRIHIEAGQQVSNADIHIRGECSTP